MTTATTAVVPSSNDRGRDSSSKRKLSGTPANSGSRRLFAFLIVLVFALGVIVAIGVQLLVRRFYNYDEPRYYYNSAAARYEEEPSRRYSAHNALNSTTADESIIRSGQHQGQGREQQQKPSLYSGILTLTNCDERVRIFQEKRFVHAETKRRLIEMHVRSLIDSPYKTTPPIAMNPTPAKWEPKPEWAPVTFPDFSIVGMAKAGTSQLYHMLTSHPDVKPFSITNKEYCMSAGGVTRGGSLSTGVHKQLYRWHEKLYQEIITNSNNDEDGDDNNNNATARVAGLQGGRYKTVNACLFVAEILRTIKWMGDQLPNRKYLITFRDPADWLWAAYNYWPDRILDFNTTSAWTQPGYFYRSPEMFHEIVASRGMIRGLPMWHHLKTGSVVTPRRLISMVGRDNVLAIRSEDMLPDVISLRGGVLDALSEFTKLPREGFPDEDLAVIRNCNNAKGESSSCGTTKTSAYAIAGYRDMLPETRELIYVLFAEECRIWNDEFGVRYQWCLDVGHKMTTL